MRETEWMVFFFIHEISEYRKATQELKGLIKDLLIDNLGRVKIIVLWDEIQENSIPGDFTYKYNLYEMIPNRTRYEYKELNPEGIDPFQRNSWKKYFRYVYKNFPSKRRLLLTWSHGSGFGISYEKKSFIAEKVDSESKKIGHELVSNDIYFVDIALIKPDKVVKDNELSFQRREFVAFSKAERPKCQKLDIVWMQEISDTLEKSLNVDEKIDILMMVNCDMQLIDNLVILKSKVKYLVAPQSGFAFYGYNYLALYRLILRHPEISNKALVREIVKDYVWKYEQELPDGRETVKDDSLFCHNLKNVKFLVPLINNIIKALTELIKESELLLLIYELRDRKIGDTSDEHKKSFIDLGLLLKLLQKFIPDKYYPDFKIQYSQYKKLLKKINKASYVGANYIISDNYSEKKYHLTGVSIFFPPSVEEFRKNELALCSYYNFSTLSRFAVLTAWDEFLSKYFHRLEELKTQGANVR